MDSFKEFLLFQQHQQQQQQQQSKRWDTNDMDPQFLETYQQWKSFKGQSRDPSEGGDDGHGESFDPTLAGGNSGSHKVPFDTNVQNPMRGFGRGRGGAQFAQGGRGGRGARGGRGSSLSSYPFQGGRNPYASQAEGQGEFTVRGRKALTVKEMKGQMFDSWNSERLQWEESPVYDVIIASQHRSKVLQLLKRAYYAPNNTLRGVGPVKDDWYLLQQLVSILPGYVQAQDKTVSFDADRSERVFPNNQDIAESIFNIIQATGIAPKLQAKDFVALLNHAGWKPASSALNANSSGRWKARLSGAKVSSSSSTSTSEKDVSSFKAALEAKTSDGGTKKTKESKKKPEPSPFKGPFIGRRT